MSFACSICEQESARICVSCTKDACDNHICETCACCSDCCECDVPLTEPIAAPAVAAVSASEPAVEQEPDLVVEPTFLSEPAADAEFPVVPSSEPAISLEFPLAPPAVPTPPLQREDFPPPGDSTEEPPNTSEL